MMSILLQNIHYFTVWLVMLSVEHKNRYRCYEKTAKKSFIIVQIKPNGHNLRCQKFFFDFFF